MNWIAVTGIFLLVIGLAVVVQASGVSLIPPAVDEKGDPYYRVQCSGEVGEVLGFDGIRKASCERVDSCRKITPLSIFDWTKREGSVSLVADGEVLDRASTSISRIGLTPGFGTDDFQLSACTSANEGEVRYLGETGRTDTEKVIFS